MHYTAQELPRPKVPRLDLQTTNNHYGYIAMTAEKPGAVLPRTLTASQATELIIEIARDEWRVEPTKHCYMRMEQRDIAFSEVLRVLRRGAVTRSPTWSELGNWNIVVEGDSSGQHLRIVCALDVDRFGMPVIVVTVILL